MGLFASNEIRVVIIFAMEGYHLPSTTSILRGQVQDKVGKVSYLRWLAQSSVEMICP